MTHDPSFERLLAGRLELVGGNRALAPLQFSLGDILEWSTAVALLLGVFRWLPASTQETLRIPPALAADGLLRLEELRVLDLLLSPREVSR